AVVPAAQHGSAEAGPVHLAAVRVAAQHQVTTVSVQVLDGSRIVSQHDAGNRSGESLEGTLGVANAAPEVLHASQVNVVAAAGQVYRFIAKDADAALSQRVSHSPMQVAVAAKAERVAHGEIVIAQHGKNAVRRL